MVWIRRYYLSLPLDILQTDLIVEVILKIGWDLLFWKILIPCNYYIYAEYFDIFLNFRQSATQQWQRTVRIFIYFWWFTSTFGQNCIFDSKTSWRRRIRWKSSCRQNRIWSFKGLWNKCFVFGVYYTIH